jgi:penicillin-binding protein 1C
MKRRLRRWLRRGLLGALALLVALLAFVYLVPFPAELLAAERAAAPRVLDRRGELLRQGLAADGTRGTWVALADVSPWLVTATLVAEDRRFRDHRGVDFLSVLRATRDNVGSGRRVSGASTITMQLVKLLRPQKRDWRTKAEEAMLALRLERALSKEQILEQYLNRAPYGGNFVGVEAAAERTFGKPARDLSPAEAALLAGLPQAPARFDPLRHFPRAQRRQRWILDEMHRLGHLNDEAYQRAIEEAPRLEVRTPPCEAESFVDWVLRPGDRDVRTTLDGALQREIEGILRESAGHLAACGARECSVVVLDNASGEIRAFAGPATRRRSPGSTLKPFVYALAIDAGDTPATLYEDAPVHFDTPTGVYSPRNYDGNFYGPLTMRLALANSLNIPAVQALRRVGVARFVEVLRAAGLEGIDPDPRRHGLGLVIGNADVSPLELAGAYAAIARGGRYLPPQGRAGPAAPRPLLSPQASYLIADILSDDGARALAFGTETDLAFDFRVAAKTGTSPDHRDNWVAGFTREHTVVVWVGNPDGRPLRGTSGLEGAGPVFRQVLLKLGGGWLERPAGIEEASICSETGLRPTTGCGRISRELFPAGDGSLRRLRAEGGALRGRVPPSLGPLPARRGSAGGKPLRPLPRPGAGRRASRVGAGRETSWRPRSSTTRYSGPRPRDRSNCRSWAPGSSCRGASR